MMNNTAHETVRGKKLLPYVLLLCLVCSSCAENAGSGNTDTQTAPVSTAVVTEAETADPTISPIEEKDYNGDTIRFSAHTQEGINFNLCDVQAAEETGDVINDAVFHRNAVIMDKYNVQFDWIESTAPDGKIRAAVKAGDDSIDIGLTALGSSFSLGVEGTVCDLNTVPWVDLTSVGWNTGITDDTSVGGKNFFGIGDINLLSYDGMGVVMFSKNLVKKNDIPDIYETVKNGKWTFDTLYGYAKMIYADLNGDGTDDKGDQYGFTCNLYASDCFALSTDIQFITKDETDYPIMDFDMDRFEGYFSRVIDMINDRSVTLFADRKEYKADRQTIPLNAFSEDRVLFYYETMAFMVQMRTMEYDFGIIPFPKLDETQKDYYNFIHIADSSAITIPRTAEASEEALDEIGRIVSDMAYYSYLLIRPAYYEKTITGKFIRDEESYDMLDLILQNCRCDYMHLMRYSGIPWVDNLRNMITKDDTNLTSLWAAGESAYQSVLDKMIDKVR